MIEKFDFNDILIEPATVSRISSRKDINPYYNGFLPLITAPMDTVISTDNEKIFHDLKINTCLPRGEHSNLGFNSYSLNEMLTNLENIINPNGYYLIDIANGHMDSLITTTKSIKDKYPNLTLMVGNIANPETYALLSEAGADYVRVGIGNGGGCFLENSLVTTDKGIKKIQEIEIDDLVLTHTGEYKKVVATTQYPTRETLIKINESVSTKNHEYYVLNKKYENIVDDNNIHEYAQWIEAKDLNDEYFLLEAE
jgi:hypothetical protein